MALDHYRPTGGVRRENFGEKGSAAFEKHWPQHTAVGEVDNVLRLSRRRISRNIARWFDFSHAAAAPRASHEHAAAQRSTTTRSGQPRRAQYCPRALHSHDRRRRRVWLLPLALVLRARGPSATVPHITTPLTTIIQATAAAFSLHTIKFRIVFVPTSLSVRRQLTPVGGTGLDGDYY